MNYQRTDRPVVINYQLPERNHTSVDSQSHWERAVNMDMIAVIEGASALESVTDTHTSR